MKHKLLKLTSLALLMTFGLPSALAVPIDPAFGIGTSGGSDVSLPETTPAPDETADIDLSSKSDDGVIRVYLKSIAGNANLTLTLSGLYTVGEDDSLRFEQGTQVIVSAAADRMYLSVGGLTMDMGTSFTLTRKA